MKPPSADLFAQKDTLTLAREEIALLRSRLEAYERAYYIDANPQVPDSTYDALFDRLKALEARYPELVTANSPTQRVGGSVAKDFLRVKHTVPLSSLDKVLSQNEFAEFCNRLGRIFPSLDMTKLHFTATPKLDGVSIRLRYERGELVLAATRGDGIFGEDVTSNVRTIKNLPLRLVGEGASLEFIEFRGEVLFFLDDFFTMNRELEAAGEKTFVNPRNGASGSLRQLDSRITASRPLKIFVYEILDSSRHFATHSEKLDFAGSCGLPMVPNALKSATPQQIVDYFSRIEDMRDKLPFEIDGVVIKLDRVDLQEQAGELSHHPRWAVAWKFASQEAVTRLLDVTWNVGRTAVIAPVAQLEPVYVAGVTIRNASLHNEDEIARLGLMIGDHVLIKRAGDVIPDIVKVLEDLRDGSQQPIIPPEECPICKATLSKPEGEIFRRCPNRFCPAIVAESIAYFASKTAFDIEGLGDKQIETLLAAGLIADAADLFSLDVEKLAALERWGEVLAKKIVKNIENSKKISTEKLLVSLGIPGVGEHSAKILVEHFVKQGHFAEKTPTNGAFEKIAGATTDELRGIFEIGTKTAQSIVDFFADAHNRAFLTKIFAAGVIPSDPVFSEKDASSPFFGKTVVLTGELANLSRAQAKKLVEDAGGKVAGSVSSRTDMVIVGENAGSKLNTAKKLGIRIVEENEFMLLLSK